MIKKQIVQSIALIMICCLLISCGITPPPAVTDTPIPSVVPSPTTAPSPTSTPITQAAAQVNSSEATTVSLPNGAAVIVPTGSLPAGSNVSIERVEPLNRQDDADIVTVLGEVYAIELDNKVLEKPVTIELPYDPNLIPDDISEEELFLSYLDEEKNEWQFAGGTVDAARNVVSVESHHASYWTVTGWNWNMVVTNAIKITKLSFVDAADSIRLMTKECSQVSKNVKIHYVDKQTSLAGCIVKDDPVTPTVRVTNLMSFYVTISPYAEGENYFATRMLAPGEEFEFQIDRRAPSPLKVTAFIDKKAAQQWLTEKVLEVLPGIGDMELDKRAKLLQCMASSIGYVEELNNAAGYWLNGDELRAFDEMAQFYLKKGSADTLRSAGKNCGYPQASTIGVKGKLQIASMFGSIWDSMNFSANLGLSHWFGAWERELQFEWQQLAPTSTPTPTQTPTQVFTDTPVSMIPTIKITQQANCRYGPGTAYLYAYGVYPGDEPTVLGRNYSGSWLLINPPNTKIQCWISIVSAEVSGDVKQAPFVSHWLPRTTASIPPTNVIAVRDGNSVTVSWDQIHTNMVDQRGYLIEANICQNGLFISVVVQTDNTSYQFTDDTGCATSSNGKIYSVDTRGYTDAVIIPWP